MNYFSHAGNNLFHHMKNTTFEDTFQHRLASNIPPMWSRPGQIYLTEILNFLLNRSNNTCFTINRITCMPAATSRRQSTHYLRVVELRIRNHSHEKASFVFQTVLTLTLKKEYFIHWFFHVFFNFLFFFLLLLFFFLFLLFFFLKNEIKIFLPFF